MSYKARTCFSEVWPFVWLLDIGTVEWTSSFSVFGRRPVAVSVATPVAVSGGGVVCLCPHHDDQGDVVTPGP